MEQSSLLNHVGGPRIVDEVQMAARLAMNRSLNSLIPSIQAQCFDAAEKALPLCDGELPRPSVRPGSQRDADIPVLPEWASLPIYVIILKLMGSMSARVMVGPDLCKAWAPLSAEYMHSILTAPAVVRARYPAQLYWLAKYFNPQVKSVLRVRERGAELIRPTIEARQRDFEENGAAAAVRHDDMIQWMMEEHRSRSQRITPDVIVQNIFIVMFASMHGTSTIAYSVLLDLLALPETLDEIREEIDRVRESELKGGSVWTRHALGELRLLDSCMKETHRVHPFTEGTYNAFPFLPPPAQRLCQSHQLIPPPLPQ